jgi:hypothetical protein
MSTVLVLMLISGVMALSCPEARQPVVRFIDFYIAAQKADAPKLTFWERVVYGVAQAKPDKRIKPLNETACRR